MSPVAADLASACSAEGADGDAEAVLVLVVGAAAGGEGFVVVSERFHRVRLPRRA